MITTTTTRQARQARQAQRAGQQSDQRIDRRAERACENSPQQAAERAAGRVAEYVFATVNGRYEVHVVRRGAGAWAVRLRGYALHRDGCFWPVPDEVPAPGTTPGATPGATPGTAPAGTGPGSRRLQANAHGGEPTYRLDEAIARTLQALVRLP